MECKRGDESSCNSVRGYVCRGGQRGGIISSLSSAIKSRLTGWCLGLQQLKLHGTSHLTFSSTAMAAGIVRGERQRLRSPHSPWDFELLLMYYKVHGKVLQNLTVLVILLEMKTGLLRSTQLICCTSSSQHKVAAHCKWWKGPSVIIQFLLETGLGAVVLGIGDGSISIATIQGSGFNADVRNSPFCLESQQDLAARMGHVGACLQNGTSTDAFNRQTMHWQMQNAPHIGSFDSKVATFRGCWSKTTLSI